MFSEHVEKLKQDTSHIIMGAYLAGVAEGVAVIDKKTPLKVLGESFCYYNENSPIDLTKRTLVNLNDYSSAPESGGVTSSLINQANDKIQQRADLLSASGLGYAECCSELARYATKVQKAAIVIAKGEGALDNDLKEDFRVLLKEAKDEFIKREQEEEQNEAVTDNFDMPMEDPNGEQPFGDEQVSDEYGDFGEEPANEFGEEGQEDQPYEEFGEENENGEEQPEENTDFGIPDGSFESSKIKADGRTPVAESWSALFSELNKPEKIDERAFEEALEKRNRKVSFAENAKYYYKGKVISTAPYDLKRMVKDVIEIEQTSIAMLGESFNLNNVIDNEELALKHKTTVNELAIVLAARNKFGFR